MYTITDKDVEKLQLPGRACSVLVGSGKLAAKNLTFGVTEVPPMSAMTPHVHENEEEVIYVLEGDGEAWIDDAREKITPGTAIYLPIGSRHYLSNQSDSVMRFVFVFSPKVKIGSYDNSEK